MILLKSFRGIASSTSLPIPAARAAILLWKLVEISGATALESNRQKLERLTAEHDRLQRELSQTEQPSEKLRAAMERNERQIADTTAKIEAQEARLRTLGDELSDAGVDTSRLAQENERLAKSYGRLKNSQEEIARLNTAIEKNGEAISGAKRKFAGRDDWESR